MLLKIKEDCSFLYSRPGLENGPRPVRTVSLIWAEKRPARRPSRHGLFARTPHVPRPRPRGPEPGKISPAWAESWPSCGRPILAVDRHRTAAQLPRGNKTRRPVLTPVTLAAILLFSFSLFLRRHTCGRATTGPQAAAPPSPAAAPWLRDTELLSFMLLIALRHEGRVPSDDTLEEEAAPPRVPSPACVFLVERARSRQAVLRQCPGHVPVRPAMRRRAAALVFYRTTAVVRRHAGDWGRSFPHGDGRRWF